MRSPTAALLLLATVPASAIAVEPGSAAARVAATAAAALRHAPELHQAEAAVTSAAAAALAAAPAGAPYLEMQSEGVGSSWTREPNAQDTVRVGTPFTFPWHWRLQQRIEDAAASWEVTGSTGARLEVVGRAGAVWLALAESEERLSVVRERLDRLDEALALQRERLRLGEVAGSEVTQLELARASEAVRLAAIVAERSELAGRLSALCGGQAVLPRPGDLAALVAATRDPVLGAEPGDRLAAAPALRAAADEAAARRAVADLAAATAWGRPEAEAEWEHFPTVDGVPGWDAIGLRVSLPLPVGAAGRRARAAAVAQARAAEAELATAQQHLELAVRSAAGRAVGARDRLEAVNPVVDRLPGTEHSLAEQFRLGAISYLFYIDGLARLDEVRLDALAARADLLDARLELAVLLADPDIFPLPDAVSVPDEAEAP